MDSETRSLLIRARFAEHGVSFYPACAVVFRRCARNVWRAGAAFFSAKPKPREVEKTRRARERASECRRRTYDTPRYVLTGYGYRAHARFI